MGQPFVTQIGHNAAALALSKSWLERVLVFDDKTVCTSLAADSNVGRYLYDFARKSLSIDFLIHNGWALWLARECKGSLKIDSIPYSGELWRVAKCIQDNQCNNLDQQQRVVVGQYIQILSRAQLDRTKGEMLEFAFNINPSLEVGKELAQYYVEAQISKPTVDVWEVLTMMLPETTAEYWWAVGERELAQQQWSNAAKAFESGASRAIDAFDYWIQAGRAWEKNKEWFYALSAYLQAHELKPSDVMPFYYIGGVYRQLGRYEDAMLWYKRVESLQPDNYAPYYWQGVVSYELEKFNRAKLLFQKTQQMNPELASTYYYLALLANREHQSETADLLMQRAIILEENSENRSWWLLMLGKWRAIDGRCEDALEALSVAVQNEGVAVSNSAVNTLELFAAMCR
jgi:tetratricopeptide (TPR) repeat protein